MIIACVDASVWAMDAQVIQEKEHRLNW